jgi:hypothetical protein
VSKPSRSAQQAPADATEAAFDKLAPAPPNMTRAALIGGAGPMSRKGYNFFIPGRCLDPNTTVWTDEQRENGIFVRMTFLTAAEEEKCITESDAKGRHSGIAQSRMAFCAIAPSVPVEGDGEGDDGRSIGPGAWKPIGWLDKDPYWNALGSQGRQLAGAAFNLANAADEEARKAMKDTFRIEG